MRCCVPGIGERQSNIAEQGIPRPPLKMDFHPSAARLNDGERAMDGFILNGFGLGLFLLAAFLGGLTTGVAGFAMGLVVSGVWLHIITPMQTAFLIVACSLLPQAFSIWKLRDALSWRRLAPFVVGGVVGVPLGTMLLSYINPSHVRLGIGALLVIFSIYNLAKPDLRKVPGGVSADVGVGFFNGLLGGLTGLGGIIVTVWCQLRGWPKDVQRTVFQPIILVSGIFTVASFTAAGAATPETLKLLLLGVPVMLAGVWFGLKLYGKLDEVVFRKVVLWLLLLSGLSLIVPSIMSIVELAHALVSL
jgi:uncharacterized membrane protein YfcA